MVLGEEVHSSENEFLYLFPLGYGGKPALLSSAGWLAVDTLLVRQDRWLHAGCREGGTKEER